MQLINETLGQLQLGEAASFERLTVFLLLGAPSRAADYLTLDEATGGSGGAGLNRGSLGRSENDG